MPTEKLTPELRGRKRWAALIAMDEPTQLIVESLRYRDQDHHNKCGALLGFSGLLIASDLVQFAASPDTIAYLSPDSPWLRVAGLGFLALILCSALSIVSMSYGRWRYSDDPWEALHQFADVINVRSGIEIAAIWLCAFGGVASMASLFATLFFEGHVPFSR
ncbi:MAG: hypothetical protein KJS97_00595 [Alphaproteobacteria bacterium]|nr:hypothetical protein [Alphaproteobacteria bacterium]